MTRRPRPRSDRRVQLHALLVAAASVAGAALGTWLARDLGALALLVGGCAGALPGALLALRTRRAVFLAVRDELDAAEESLDDVSQAPSVGGRSLRDLVERVYRRHALRAERDMARARAVADRDRAHLEDAVARERAAREQAEGAHAEAAALLAAREAQLAYLDATLRPAASATSGAIEVILDSDLAPPQLRLLTVARSSLATLGAALDLHEAQLSGGEVRAAEAHGFSPRRLVAAVLRGLSPEAERRGIEIVLRCAAEVPSRCEADARLLEQALTLLVVWSLASSRAEHLVVHLGVAHPDAAADPNRPVLELTVERPHPVASHPDGIDLRAPITVAGPGRADVGARVAARLLAAADGALRFERSALGASRAVFTFPVVRQRRVTATTLYGRGAITDKTVLVVDDLAASRDALSEQLATWRLLPTAVDDVASAMQALRDAQRGQQPFDVIVLDRHMPGRDGLALLREIAADPTLGPQRVILLDHLVDLARPLPDRLGSSVTARVLKPILPSELLEVLTAALAPPRSAPQVNTRPGLRPEPDKRGVKVLVAEDNPVNQMFTARLLEKRGHHVTVASNGADVIDALDTSPEPFDIILMDIQMPVLDGIEATAIIRERERRSGGPRLPIIAVTAHAMHGEEQRMLDAGLDAYIPKPIAEARLFEAIERLLPPGFHRARRRTPPHGMAQVDERGAVFDEAKVMSFVAGDHEFLTTLVELFVETAPKQLTTIREAVAAGDALALERAAHQLKGSVSNFSADRARRWAQELEQAGRAGDLSAAPAAVTSLEAELAALGEALGDLARRHT